MFSSVDIYSPVSPKSKISNEYEITIGDLHSNTLLFLFFLRKNQIFLISDEDYSFIVKAYIDLESAQKRNLPLEEVKPNIEKIIQIISDCTVLNKPRLRLIGDEMADRGVSDLFILMILQKLHLHQVPYRILLSNHGLCFLSLFFGWVNNTKQQDWILDSKVKTEYSFQGLKYAVVDIGVYTIESIGSFEKQVGKVAKILFEFSEVHPTFRKTILSEIDFQDGSEMTLESYEASLKLKLDATQTTQALEDFLEKIDKKLKNEKVDDLERPNRYPLEIYKSQSIYALVKDVYLPFLEVIDYSLCPIEQRISIYSHAAIGLDDIALLAVYCNVEMRFQTIRELANTIENIKYQFKRQKFDPLCHFLSQVSDKDKTDSKGALEVLKLINPVLWKICWNRNYSPQNLQRIKYMNDYQLRYVHGHDHKYSKDAHCITLDGKLGKSIVKNRGELKEFKTKDVPLSKYTEYSFLYKLLMRHVYQPEGYGKYFPYVALGLAIFVIQKNSNNHLSKVFSLFSNASNAMFKGSNLQNQPHPDLSRFSVLQ